MRMRNVFVDLECFSRIKDLETKRILKTFLELGLKTRIYLPHVDMSLEVNLKEGAYPSV
jgi:hypothetical protein